LPDLAKSLKDGVTIQDLERRAKAQSDTAAATEMQQAKAQLLASIQKKKTA